MSQDPSPTSQLAPAGYEIVADLLRRQETVLEELDLLNDRVEVAIKLIASQRETEIESENESETDSQIISIESEIEIVVSNSESAFNSPPSDAIPLNKAG